MKRIFAFLGLVVLIGCRPAETPHSDPPKAFVIAGQLIENQTAGLQKRDSVVLNEEDSIIVDEATIYISRTKATQGVWKISYIKHNTRDICIRPSSENDLQDQDVRAKHRIGDTLQVPICYFGNEKTIFASMYIPIRITRGGFDIIPDGAHDDFGPLDKKTYGTMIEKNTKIVTGLIKASMDQKILAQGIHSPWTL